MPMNVNVIPGHGGPSVGLYDILIEGNEITEMRRFSPYDPAEEREHIEGDRVIDGTDKWVMPGMINLHLHLRDEPLPLDYVYYLQLVTGITTVGPAADRGLDEAMTDAGRSARNEMLAPRMFPIWRWAAGTDYTRAQLEDPAMAPEIARAMVDQGGHVVSLGSVTWSDELFGAVANAVWDAGGITTIHSGKGQESYLLLPVIPKRKSKTVVHDGNDASVAN